ncbi:MAG: DnaJ domain-containing protein [Nitrospiraceae bacterium]|nr:DnaJ domain-containing protein [Nitrospiraceae bacterium]
MDFETAYKILKIDPGTDVEDIDKAFRRMARRYPPEFRPGRFAKIRAAYEYLTSLKVQVDEIKKDPFQASASLLGIYGLAEPLPPLKQVPFKTEAVDWKPVADLLSQGLLLDILRRHLRQK